MTPWSSRVELWRRARGSRSVIEVTSGVWRVRKTPRRRRSAVAPGAASPVLHLKQCVTHSQSGCHKISPSGLTGPLRRPGCLAAPSSVWNSREPEVGSGSICVASPWRAANRGRSRLLGGQSRLKAGCGQNCPPSNCKLTHYPEVAQKIVPASGGRHRRAGGSLGPQGLLTKVKGIADTAFWWLSPTEETPITGGRWRSHKASLSHC